MWLRKSNVHVLAVTALMLNIYQVIKKTTINLNPLHPFTLVNTKPKGKQTFRCKKCGRVFETKL